MDIYAIAIWLYVAEEILYNTARIVLVDVDVEDVSQSR